MLHNDKIKKTEFIGPLKNVLTSFLDEMRLTGRVYGSESFYLRACIHSRLSKE